MQAIITKYLGPTDTRGGRVKAKCDAGSVTVSWDHALDIELNHRAAALALITKLGWLDMAEVYGLATGSIPSGEYVHAFARERHAGIASRV